MDSNNGPIEMPDVEYADLSQPPTLNEDLLTTIDSNINCTNWIQSHQCITMLRQILKSQPHFIPDITNRYSNAFVDLFTNGKTQIIKNLLRMVKEIFDHGKDANVERAVYVFLPILLKKSSTDLGHIKEMSQQALTSFSNNCGFDISFVSNCFTIQLLRVTAATKAHRLLRFQ
jgi:pterin-4a-carbinolamine dehydratase